MSTYHVDRWLAVQSTLQELQSSPLATGRRWDTPGSPSYPGSTLCLGSPPGLWTIFSRESRPKPSIRDWHPGEGTNPTYALMWQHSLWCKLKLYPWCKSKLQPGLSDSWAWRGSLNNLVGGWTNPFEIYESKWESSPSRDENKKKLKPPPSNSFSSKKAISIIKICSKAVPEVLSGNVWG